MVHRMETEAVTAAIAAQLRKYRGERGWTLDEMAERSGVSRRMLVNLERGSVNPSIVTLLRISDALGVGLPALVDAARKPSLSITRSGTAPVLWRGSCGGTAELVAGSEPPDVVELWNWTLSGGDTHTSEPHSPGTRELLLVLSGKLALTVGDAVEALSAGDSASFPGDLPHTYAHAGRSNQPARFALAVFQPGVRAGPR
jgi:transcriptional regulator with XRE-family HTH domain